MATPRTIPSNTGWLRRYCVRRLGIRFPDDATEEEIAAICAEIPPAKWRKLSKAWAEHNRRQTEGMVGPWGPCNAYLWYDKPKILGPLWRKLIIAGAVTEEDARVIAEHGIGKSLGTAYCDTLAVSVLNRILSRAADDIRGADKADARAVRSTASVISGWRRMHPDDCPTDSVGWSQRFDLDLGLVEEALALLDDGAA